VRLALGRWGLAALAEDAELVVSELVTNAVQASGVTDPDAAWGDLGALATIQVRVLMYQADIVIEVWDRDPGSPVRHDAASHEEGGRGLLIVTALCKEWDYFYAAHGGKVVWAELAVPAELLTLAGLPRRVCDLPVVAGNRADPMRDPGLLRRVHRGLNDL
jgi:anti-sigma regulatory factor (Ser/Thr protein kinase)